MAEGTNRKITLKSRPDGYPTLDDFELIEEPITQPREGEVLIRSIWLSLDPYMRGRMRDAASYAPSVQLGDVMVGGAVGRIVESRTPAFSVGEIVEGRLGWQEYAVSDGARPAPRGSRAGAALNIARHTRHARDDRVLRILGCPATPDRAIRSWCPRRRARSGRSWGR